VLLEDLVGEVGVDAARFFYLAKSLDTQMEFDMDLAKEQSAKNPVYYVQYAHARMQSILAKAPSSKKSTNYKLLNHPLELNLIKYVLRWPEVVEDTAKDYQLQRVTGYAYDLATVFNQFYRDCKVISDDENMTEARLGLVWATQKILHEVLGALGISAPDKM
jgi:arginyl-tRNA synthetase